MANIIVVRFRDGTGSFRALTILRDLEHQGRIAVAEADVVERLPHGQIRMTDEGDGVGILGEVIEVLGGPLGLLLKTDQDSSPSHSALAGLGSAIPPGSTVLLAAVAERTEDAIDDAINRIGGSVVRRPAVEVLAELEAVDVAQAAATREAEHMLREQKLGGLRQRASRQLEALTARL